MADSRFTPPPLVDAEGADWNETIGTSEQVTAGRYQGSEARAQHPWNCPACGVQNIGRLALGCVHCGSGKPGYHVGLPPPAKAAPPISATLSGITPLSAFEEWLAAYTLDNAGEWIHSQEQVDRLQAAFQAGWIAGAQQQAHRTLQAPPVTVDLRTLAPETKAQRTIIAALELFKDQVLISAKEEIASGEWCSVEEVESLIAQLKDQL